MMHKFISGIETPQGYAIIEKTLYVAFLIAIAHMVSGLIVFFVPDAIHVTPLSNLPKIIPNFGVTEYGNIRLIGVILFLVGLTAFIGSSVSKMTVMRRLACIAPQQALLFFQLWAIASALYYGVYPDGYGPHGGSWFILADQIWTWMLSVSHTLEFFAIYVISRRVM